MDNGLPRNNEYNPFNGSITASAGTSTEQIPNLNENEFTNEEGDRNFDSLGDMTPNMPPREPEGNQELGQVIDLSTPSPTESTEPSPDQSSIAQDEIPIDPKIIRDLSRGKANQTEIKEFKDQVNALSSDPAAVVEFVKAAKKAALDMAKGDQNE